MIVTRWQYANWDLEGSLNVAVHWTESLILAVEAKSIRTNARLFGNYARTPSFLIKEIRRSFIIVDNKRRRTSSVGLSIRFHRTSVDIELRDKHRGKLIKLKSELRRMDSLETNGNEVKQYELHTRAQTEEWKYGEEK